MVVIYILGSGVEASCGLVGRGSEAYLADPGLTAQCPSSVFKYRNIDTNQGIDLGRRYGPFQETYAHIDDIEKSSISSI
jgi:hypothetical protein